MHRQPWPYMDHMASSTLLPFAAIATVKTVVEVVETPLNHEK